MKLRDVKLEVEAIISRTEITGVARPFCSVNDKIKEVLEAESTEDELKDGFQEITKVISKSFEEIKEAHEAASKAVDKLKLSLAEKGCFNLDFYQDEDDLIVVDQYDILLEGVLYTHNRDVDGNYHCMVKESITDFEL